MAKCQIYYLFVKLMVKLLSCSVLMVARVKKKNPMKICIGMNCFKEIRIGMRHGSSDVTITNLTIHVLILKHGLKAANSVCYYFLFQLFAKEIKLLLCSAIWDLSKLRY